MSEEQDYYEEEQQRESAFVSKAKRSSFSARQQSERLSKNMTNFFKEAIKDDFIGPKIKQELRNIQNGGTGNKHSKYAVGKFDQDKEHVTGFEPRLWERD